MKKIILIVLLAALIWGIVASVKSIKIPEAASIEFPTPTGYVVDAGEVLPAEVENRLETVLSDFAAKTTNEIAVVTVKSLEGLSIEEYSIRLAELWRVGQQTTDNGVVFLTAVQDRKTRIEVGKGLEEILTDAKTGQLLDENVIPFFRSNLWAEGILSGTEALNEVINEGTRQ